MKKTTQFISVILLFTSLFLTSCSNDDDNKESFGVTTGDYLPLEINNSWKYFIPEQSLISELKVIGSDQFNGSAYFEFIDDDQVNFTIRQWFAKKGASYFLKTGDVTVNQEGITVKIKSYELPILKDDYAVNLPWTGIVSPKVTYSGNGQSGTLPFSLSYTGVNYFKGAVTLDGITYPQVIKTRVNISINANGQITTASEEYWFAENIGIIKIITNDGNSIQEKNIVSYILN